MSATNFPAAFLDELGRAVMDRAGRPERDEVRFSCPNPDHPDARPSARWNPGKALWHCDSCNEGGGALDLAHLLDVERPRGTRPAVMPAAGTEPAPRVIAATFDYVDPAGELVFQVVRYNPKGFSQRRPDENGGWIWNTQGVPPVPYKLPELLASNDPVIIVEGEACVDALAAAGFTVTTNHGGAGKWTAAHAAFLAGRDVAVIPDNDEPGRRHADAVAATLQGIVRSVRVLDPLPGVPEKGDVVDWLADGGTAEQLRALVDGAPEWSPEPAPEAPQPLGEVHTFLGRFVAYPSAHAHVAHVLWIAHAHLMDAWESTPRLAFLSPEPASGKTRALEVTELLVPNPVEAVNVTPPYLFRKVGNDDEKPTILFDEIDTVFGPKAKDNEEIRGLLNAGHRVGAVAGRCFVRGKIVETEEIPAYCAVAMAGLGGLPDTILSRSVIVRMRRRAASERVDPYRRRVEAPAGHELRDRLAAWADTIRDRVRDAWPAMPAGIEDRDSDIWEPLLAVADAAGGDWPDRARLAAVSLVSESRESTPSLGVRLLDDLRRVFGDRDAMATDAILSSLCALDEAPWGELVGGKPLNARGLARRLGEYGVSSRTVRTGSGTSKGYRREDLADGWGRYLQPVGSPPQECDTSVTNVTAGDAEPHKPHGFKGFGSNGAVTDADLEKVTPDRENDTCDTQEPHESGDVTHVTHFRRDELAGEAGADKWTA